MNETTRKLLFTSQIRKSFISKQHELFTAKNYLKRTDYIVIKINEAVIKGQDTSELLSKYAEQLAKRDTYRNSIDTLEAEVKTLEQEWREERARIIAEETSEEVTEVDTSEQSTNAPNEEVVEVDTTNQPSDNTTNTSESVEETPSEQPIKETPTEVVENLE